MFCVSSPGAMGWSVVVAFSGHTHLFFLTETTRLNLYLTLLLSKRLKLSKCNRVEQSLDQWIKMRECVQMLHGEKKI